MSNELAARSGAALLRRLHVTEAARRETAALSASGSLADLPEISESLAERAAFLICNRVGDAGKLDDDVLAFCAGCATAIYHRPHVPRRPAKLCFTCAVARAGL